MKLKTGGKELVSIIKFVIVLGIIFFLYLIFPPTTCLKTLYNMAPVFRVHPVLGPGATVPIIFMNYVDNADKN